jgi:hypothetical protein
MARQNIGREEVNMWERRQKSLNNNNNNNNSIQFNSILIYLHANLTAQGQLQSKHELK